MEFILTNHAKQRMIEREINLSQIQETINYPEYTIKKSNKIEAYKRFDGKLLTVVYILKGKFIKIVTIIWK